MATRTRAAARGEVVGGINGYVRRLLFPDFPPTECVDGLIFFPWGTGPFWPVPCEQDPLLPTPGPFGSQFMRKPGSAFVDVVAELAQVSRAQASRAVAKAAGVNAARLARLTTVELGKAIFENTAGKLDTVGRDKAQNGTVADFLEALDRKAKPVNAPDALRTLSAQTGVDAAELSRLRVDQLGGHLDLIDTPAQPVTLARSSGTLVCGTAGGQTRCGVISGIGEGILWGGIIGGIIGGGVGAAIGAVVGGLISAIGSLFD